MRGVASHLLNCTHYWDSTPSFSPLLLLLLLKLFLRMVMMGIGRMVGSLKSKLRSLKMTKKHYDKVEKSESMRIEIRSRKARKLIQQTLKLADSPSPKTLPF
ncbi:hypothetical protein V6N13_131589 [Hibiscus sabdariffa]|uniref:Transmembrane protein n=1 Tax=Hibiscus sabdariffa TaxID=183260 RepID=A0ABR2D8C3_9ROSI